MNRLPALCAAILLAASASLFAAKPNKSSGSPSFNRDIAPILFNNCSNCHRPGEVAPFSLLTYQDAAQHAKQIAAVTEARVMPPWKAAAGHGEFLDERKLSDQQIAAIREWAKNGAPEGSAPKPEQPKFSDGWLGGQPDKIVRMPEPFSVPADGADIFQCFVIPLDAKDAEYVNKVEFRPGNAKIVHHAIFYLDATGQARKKETVAGHGYPCVGGPGVEISGTLGGWAPGAQPAVSRKGVAYTVPKGADLVMQVHYHLDGKPEEDRSAVGLSFASEPPTKGLTTFVLGNQRIDIPPGESHYTVKASSVLPMDTEAIEIFPHAHYLCKDMKVDAYLPDGTVKPLIWIPDWDFNWQGAYRYASPVQLPKGTRLEMTYVYDNSTANPRNPSNPPRQVKYGEQTTNEMAFAFVSLTLDDPSKLAEFKRGARAELIASLLENGIDEEALGPQRAGQLKLLLGAFDKNHNGKIDADERPAMVDFLTKRTQMPLR